MAGVLLDHNFTDKSLLIDLRWDIAMVSSVQFNRQNLRMSSIGMSSASLMPALLMDALECPFIILSIFHQHSCHPLLTHSHVPLRAQYLNRESYVHYKAARSEHEDRYTGQVEDTTLTPPLPVGYVPSLVQEAGPQPVVSFVLLPRGVL